MSHYRERRDKIKNLQSRSLDHLASSAASKSPSAAHQPGPLEQTQSQRRLRESSPRWKEHYSKLSQQWSSGVSFAQQESNLVWEDIRQQKEKGGYPWTHLSHHQDEEVWLNPQKLPQDIGSVTMLRKDNTIPREWFHLPKGAEVPTVDDLLRESSPELDHNDDEEVVARRAKSPPICGRQRSKSRERVPQKYLASSAVALHQRPPTPMSYDASSVTNITPAPSIYSFQNQNEESDKLTAEKQIALSHVPRDLSVPLPSKVDETFGKTPSNMKEGDKVKLLHDYDKNESDKESDSDKSTSCFPVLRKSRSRSKSKERKLQKEKIKKKAKNIENGNGNEINGKDEQCDKILSYQGPQLLPKAGSGSPKLPPKIDRTSKPSTPPKSPVSSDETDGYEPVEKSTKYYNEGKVVENMPETNSDANEQFSKDCRDASRVSGKRDSSRGSGYEPVGWEKDNLTPVHINGSRDELGSKIYEDLDEIDEKMMELPHADILVSTEASGDKKILLKESPEKQDKEIEKDAFLKEEKERKQKEKDQQKKEQIAKKQELEQEAKEKRAKEKMEKEQAEWEEKEKRRHAKEQKEKDDKLKKEQKESEEREARERKIRERVEKEQEETEAKVKKKIAKDQKEKDERLKKEQKEAEELEEKERKIKEKMEKEQAEREQKEKRKQEKEAKENEERMLKEQKELEELEAKERKAREKKEKERNEIIEKEKKKQAKEQKEQDERLRKEQKEAKETEEKERKIREKVAKEEAEKLEKQKKRETKEQNKKVEQLRKKEGSFKTNLSKEEDGEVDEMIKNKENLDTDKVEETGFPERDVSSKETEIQNYDLQEAPKMIEKERAFDEEHSKETENVETPELLGENDSIEYDHTHQVCINTNEQGPALEMHIQSSVVNEIETVNEGDEENLDRQMERNTNLNPFEEDEDSLAGEVLLINTNNASDKEVEIKQDLVKQNTNIDCHPSFPSENQITEEYSITELTNTAVNFQDAHLISINDTQSIPTLQISPDTVDKSENEKYDANKGISNECRDGIPYDSDGKKPFSKTKKEKKKDEKEAQKKMEKELKERKKKEKEDDERRKRELKELKKNNKKTKVENIANENTESKNDNLSQLEKDNQEINDIDVQTNKKDKAVKKKEENEMKKQLKEEAKKKKVEEKEMIRLKKQQITEDQKELKGRWDKQKKDDCLDKQTKLKEKTSKKNEENEMSKVLKEEIEKKKAEEKETLRLKNQQIAQQQKQLKGRWHKQEKDDSSDKPTKLKEKTSKMNEENEMNKLIKEEKEKKKAEEKETLQLKNQQFTQLQKELKGRWSRQERDDSLDKQTKLREKTSKKNEENKMNETVKEDEEKMKAEEKETLRLKSDNMAHQQKELKGRWVEQEKEDTYHKQSEIKEEIEKKNDEREMKKLLKEDKKKEIAEEKDALQLRKEQIAQRQKELKKRWIKEETERKNKINEVGDDKNEIKLKPPEIDNCIAGPFRQNEEPESVTHADMMENMKTNEPLESFSKLQDNADATHVPVVADTISCEHVQEVEDQILCTEADRTNMDDDISAPLEPQLQDTDGLSEVDGEVVENVEKEKEVIVESIDDTESKPSVPIDDPEELNILLEILKGNRDTVPPQFATKDDTNMDDTKTTDHPVENDDPEELKLLISMLNEKHIPPENRSVTERSDTAMPKEEKVMQTKSAKSKDEKGEKQKTPESQKVKDDKYKQEKLANEEEKRIEKQNKLDAKKLKNEKDKQSRLEKEEKKKIENQMKLEAKKHKEEKQNQMQLANIEEQKTLKGKWNKQEKKRNETKGKDRIEEKIISTPEEICSDHKTDDLPDIVISENVSREEGEQKTVEKGEELTTGKQNKLESKKLKEEKYEQMKLEKAEAKRAEKQHKLEERKHQEEKQKQIEMENRKKQKTLKEKWSKQEQAKKDKENRSKNDRATIEENAIPTSKVICSEPAKDDLQDIQICENVNPLLMEYAESISSDIMKEAKGKNALDLPEEVGDESECEMVEEQRSEKSSKDEDLPPALPISDENIPKKAAVQIMSHADVEKILQIIKETDDEFREKEHQILDEIERKRKEENIKEMEKELKRQKKDQEKLKKENEKAQKKREKLEKESQLKKEKEEKQMQKKMDAKLKKEQEAESRRMEQESKVEKKKKLAADSETQKQIDKEKQLAIEKEMSQYRITPDVDEDLQVKLAAAAVHDTSSKSGQTAPEDHEDGETQNPFELKDSDTTTENEDIQQSAKKVKLVAPKLKDEPKHVKWTQKILPSKAKDSSQSGVGGQAVIRNIPYEQPISKTQQQGSTQIRKIASPLPSKELFLTQPEESESRATSVMATSAGGQRSPDDLDEFAQFASGQPPNGHQNGGGVSPDEIEPDYGYEEDEMDFTPQNGYIADEQEFVPYHEEEPQPTKDKKAPKERKSREPMKMPTVDIKGKLDAMKGIKMPSAHDMAESLNPMNSLKRPLGVRVREEDPDVQRERALIVKNKTPGELGNLKSPLDIPMPKFRSRNKSAEATAKKVSKSEDTEKENVKEDTSTPGKGALFNTLPRSLRQQNLVTSVREMDDPKVLQERQELIKNYSPAELAQFKGISDFPVPSKITNMFEKVPKRAPSADQEKAAASEPNEPWSLYGTLPRSMRETKLLTNTREMLDPKELEQRQMLIRSKSPTELAQIHGVDDIPVPTKIQNIFNKTSSGSGSLSKLKRTRSESLTKGSGSMTFTLPKAWAETKLITKIKVEEDEAVLATRRNLTETKTPNELAQITSIADLPIPSALENFLKSDKKSQEVTRGDTLSPIRINLDNMYDNLPRSLNQQLLVKTKIEEDGEVLKKRQEIVASKKPAELAQIGGLSDLPVPTALENIFKGGPPTAPRRKSRDERDGKRKRNFTTGGILSYDNMPESLTKQLLVKTKIEEDPEKLNARQELTRTKTPNELGQIHGLSDFPLPEKIDTLMRPSKRNLKSTKEKQLDKKRSLSWSSLPGKISNASVPTSLKTQCLVRAKMEDPEVQKQRQEIVNTKSVAELGEMHGLSDFPIPTTLERLVDKSKRVSVADSKSEDTRPLKDKMYDTLPKSMKTELLVKVRDEDPEVQKQRQELTRSKSPVELSQMSSISDFPVPTNIEKLLQKTSTVPDDGAPIPPPRRSRLENFNKENLYETFPSLNTECMVRSRVLEDEEVIKQRQELIRSKTPAELSQIHGLDDIPVPTFVEHSVDSLKKIRTRSTERKEEGEGGTKGMYDKVPESLKCQLLVKATVEDPEIQKERADVVKTKSVNELSQVTTLSEFPVPEAIERLISRQPGAVERKKRFREKQRSLSARNLNEMLPESLKCQLLVKSKTEKPEVQRERAQLVSSKSVSELSQVTSLNDFPIPTTIERLVSKSKGDLTDGSSQRTSLLNLANFKPANIYATLPKSMTERQLLVRARVEEPEVQRSRKETTEGKSVAELSQIHSMAEFPIPATIETIIEKGRQSAQDFKDPDRSAMSSPAQLKGNIYATLPRSLKTELAVTTKIQDSERVQERREMVANKSVNELSQVTSLSDVPIPTPIQKMIDTAQNLKVPKPEGEEQNRSRPGSRGAPYDIYASLPRSLKKELLVRSKVEEDEDELKNRQTLVETKTPSELSQIHSLSEVPLPRRVEAWLHHNDQQSSHGIPQRPTRSLHELRNSLYDTMPKSLKTPTLVRTKTESPEVRKERCELVRTKTPTQLADIQDVHDIPIPGLWREREGSSSRSKNKKRRLPRNKQDIKDIVYKSILPESMTKPCVVRSRIEDPEVLVKRQELQQEKSIHELSKIRNINEFPLPLNIKLPDIPLPSLKAKNILKMIAPTAKSHNNRAGHNQEPYGEYTPASTPRTGDLLTDDEMLRYDTSTPGGDTTHRDQDFGYEIIDESSPPMISGAPQHVQQIPAQFREDILEQAQTPEEDSIAEQYRGTPPMKSKKKKPDRRSHEVPDHVQLGDELPPPLPPKRISPRKSPAVEAVKVSKSASGSRVPGSFLAQDEFLSCADDPNPLQNIPLPGASSSVHSSLRNSGSGHSFASARSGVSNQPDQFHSVASTLHSGTLVDSNNMRRDDDDNTLAESIVDSMHSCADTIVTTGDDDAALHSCADTLAESDDEIEFGDSPTPPISSG